MILDNGMVLIYKLADGFPPYKETSSHVIPSELFAVDKTLTPKEKTFIPLELKQVGKYHVHKK